LRSCRPGGKYAARVGQPGPSWATEAAAPDCSIRDIATATGVTHSAASQTVAKMIRAGLVTTSPGTDARTRAVSLTPLAQNLLPTLAVEYAATADAASALEAELSMPLSTLLDEVFEALERRPMRDRVADAATRLSHAALKPLPTP
jgi:DNA-binding MarR family transcriptional regulator